MIPKKIHYIWLGSNKKNKLIQKCIASWYQLHPNWEIIEWRDDNFTFEECDFVKLAYKNRKWAYLSDYYRLQILFLNGGIYLDTDMLSVKPLDNLPISEIFLGYETEGILNCSIMGAQKNNVFINSILEHYNKLDSNNWQKNTIPEIVTKLNKDGDYNNLTIYPVDYFYPYPFSNRVCEYNINYKKHITPNTYCVHLWEYSWSEFSKYQLLLIRRSYLKAMFHFFLEAFMKSKTFKWNELKKTLNILLKHR